jgi:hypothetical protein
MLKLPGGFDPGPNAKAVNPDAEEVCRDEAKLRRSHSNDANNHTVNAAQHESHPLLTSDQDRCENGEATRDVIQTKHGENLNLRPYVARGAGRSQ